MCDMNNLSQDDLDEINMCLSDCRGNVEKERECCRKVTAGITFKQFLFKTLPGNIILVLIVVTLIQMIVSEGTSSE